MVDKYVKSKVEDYLSFLSQEVGLLNAWIDEVGQAVDDAKHWDNTATGYKNLYEVADMLVDELKLEVEAINYFQKTTKQALEFATAAAVAGV
jgi:hypothetical protein